MTSYARSFRNDDGTLFWCKRYAFCTLQLFLWFDVGAYKRTLQLTTLVHHLFRQTEVYPTCLQLQFTIYFGRLKSTLPAIWNGKYLGFKTAVEQAQTIEELGLIEIDY